MNTLPFHRPKRALRPAVVALATALLGAWPGPAAAGSPPRPASDEFGWAVIDARHTSTMSSTDRDDWDEIQRLVEAGKDPMFWFRFDDRSWVVRDRSIVARAEEITAPVRELGRRKSELARRKLELRDQMSGSGARRSEWKAEKLELSRRKSELGLEKARRSREIEPELRRLAENALRDGRAERLSN